MKPIELVPNILRGEDLLVDLKNLKIQKDDKGIFATVSGEDSKIFPIESTKVLGDICKLLKIKDTENIRTFFSPETINHIFNDMISCNKFKLKSVLFRLDPVNQKTVRAILSNRYRVYDDKDVALEMATLLDSEQSWDVTYHKTHNWFLYSIPLDNKTRAGIKIENNEVGEGSHTVSFIVLNDKGVSMKIPGKRLTTIHTHSAQPFREILKQAVVKLPEGMQLAQDLCTFGQHLIVGNPRAWRAAIKNLSFYPQKIKNMNLGLYLNTTPMSLLDFLFEFRNQIEIWNALTPEEADDLCVQFFLEKNKTEIIKSLEETK